jgi:hypothetical protein
MRNNFGTERRVAISNRFRFPIKQYRVQIETPGLDANGLLYAQYACA